MWPSEKQTTTPAQIAHQRYPCLSRIPTSPNLFLFRPRCKRTEGSSLEAHHCPALARRQWTSRPWGLIRYVVRVIKFAASFVSLCPRHKMARGHLVFALSVIPSFRHSVTPSFRHSVLPSHQSLSSQLLLHPCMDLNETWYRCCTTSVEVHVGR